MYTQPHWRRLSAGAVVSLLILASPIQVPAQAVFQQARELIGAQQQSAPQVVQRAEEPFDEGLFEDTKESAVGEKPADADADAEPKGPPPPTRKLTVDAVVVVDYMFFHSPDRFKVKYHLNLSGDVSNDLSVLKGSAKISTDVSGFLAKWSEGECVLKVSITEVPYEIIFKKESDREADIEVKFLQAIAEDWESLCTFLDDPNATFNTRGTPEKWIALALEKASPPLNNLNAPLNEAETTTLRFTVPKHTVKDENIGSADIDGTGVVTIQVIKPEEEKKEEEKK